MRASSKKGRPFLCVLLPEPGKFVGYDGKNRSLGENKQAKMISIVRKRGPVALCITEDLEREGILWMTTF
jgi:hypothetical protein